MIISLPKILITSAKFLLTCKVIVTGSREEDMDMLGGGAAIIQPSPRLQGPENIPWQP
jgi:hypothetical protein